MRARQPYLTNAAPRRAEFHEAPIFPLSFWASCNSALRFRGWLSGLTVLCALTVTLRAGDLAFSDPATVTPVPAGAIGQANQSADFDILPGFQKPPRGFGVVPFFWWLGDPLTSNRLGWELEQMKGMGISGFQINYAHTDRGGRSYGLTFASEPALFTPAWWNLTGWFMREAKKQGAAISLSDYTLGIGQGWRVDEILREHPDIAGMQLKLDQDGKVVVETLPWSINPMHPMSGKWYADKFFGQFEHHFPGEGGKGLNFFFSDELGFGVGGRLWSTQFADEFKKRKGYDITPELAALFKDIGPRTPKVRLDYSDVMVALSEEGFFKPVFDWHQQRGMTMGCDHGGRGRDVIEFGDYFRTQRWNQGPGADQPGLGKDLIKAKVASSIAHLYQRPRVWLEGFYGSGWGTTSAGVVDATFADFVMGYNLLSLHGMYYATHGGWWEWAPPDNTFRMPYWKHLNGFMTCVQRLSYLFTQGYHRCDVAILYPVAPMEAGMDGAQAVREGFAAGERLYSQGVDFDFIDFQSLDRARIVDHTLQVSGEIYPVLVLPAMKAVRHSTLQKAVQFRRAGGVVMALGALPEASDRMGREDPEVAAMVKELFPNGPTREVFEQLPARDYAGPGRIQHRRIGHRDIYAIYGAPKDTLCTFRATGQVELWDPWTGAARPLPVVSQADGFTKLRLPLSETELQLVIFSPGTPQTAPEPRDERREVVKLEGDWEFELQPTSDNRFGDFHWPPTRKLIGAEVRQLWYCEGDHTNGPWRKVTCSFGPQFIQSTSLPAAAGESKLCEFSWRWGIEGDPGHQGWHGLKEDIHDELFAIGERKKDGGASPTVYNYVAGGPGSCFSSAVLSPREQTAYILTGALKPVEAWVNGELTTSNIVKLHAGANSVALKYDHPGRAYFVMSTEPETAAPGQGSGPEERPRFRLSPLASRWWTNQAVLKFDVRAADATPVGWYRFIAPPGLRSFKISARGKVQAWLDGQVMAARKNGVFAVRKPVADAATVLLRIEQERGCYGGAAISEPIELGCVPGRIALGDWSANESLVSYSGGAWYRKTVTLPRAREITLNLGNLVASAEIRVNGHRAGIKVSPPWTIDISPWAKPGENRIEVLVCNTLANHYTSVPTQYRGSTLSGLLGPVTIEVKK